MPFIDEEIDIEGALKALAEGSKKGAEKAKAPEPPPAWYNRPVRELVGAPAESPSSSAAAALGKSGPGKFVSGKATPADIGEVGVPMAAMLPFALATGGMGPLAALGMEGLGMAAGEAGRQGYNRLLDRPAPLTSAQAATEIGGSALLGAGLSGLSKVPGALTRTLTPKPTSALGREALDMGLPLAPTGVRGKIIRSTILGNKTAETAGQPGLEKAAGSVREEAARLGAAEPIIPEMTVPALKRAVGETKKAALTGAKEAAEADKKAMLDTLYVEAKAQVQDTLNFVGSQLDPQDAGEILHAAVGRGGPGIEAAKRRAGELYRAVDDGIAEVALQGGQTPDVKLGEDFWPRLAQFQGENSIYPNPKLSELIQNAEALGPIVKYGTARQIQQGLGKEFGDGFRQVVAGKQAGQAMSLWKEVSGALKESLATADPKILQAFERANGFYHDFADEVKRGIVPQLISKYPSKFVKTLKDDSIEEAQALRTILWDYPQYLGSKAEKEAGAKAYNTLGRAFADEKILKDGIEKLPERMAAIEPRVLEAIYSRTPEGRSFISNTARVADKIEKVTQEVAERAANPTSPDFKELNKLNTILEESAAGKVSGNQGFTPYSGGAISYVIGSLVGFPKMVVGTELVGGFTAWALYKPKAAEALAKGMDTWLHGGALVTSPALSAFFNQYLDEEGIKRRNLEPWKYLTPPPGFEPGQRVLKLPERMSIK